MTLQQLKYFIEISQSGSMHTAAKNLFVSQPSLSKAISELEKEMNLMLLHRSNRGVRLTEDGIQFLAHARQVVEQADLIESRYKNAQPVRRVFAVSAQHYAFAVNAFVRLVEEYDVQRYEFSLRESRTQDIIEDVRLGRSEIGILYLSAFNREILTRILHNSELTFCPLFTAAPHVFVSRRHPLAKQSFVEMEQLKAYPRLTFEQGVENSFSFAEEPHSTAESPKNIVVTDRATLFNLLIGLNGYTISSGVLNENLNGTEIVSVPLVSDQQMEIGYICQGDGALSPMAGRYLEHLSRCIAEVQPKCAIAKSYRAQ